MKIENAEIHAILTKKVILGVGQKAATPVTAPDHFVNNICLHYGILKYRLLISSAYIVHMSPNHVRLGVHPVLLLSASKRVKLPEGINGVLVIFWAF